MAMIGVLALVEIDRREWTVDSLCALNGVDVFSVEQEHQVGILIERQTIADAQQTLHEQVEETPGVLCAWPVYSHVDGDD